MALYKLKLVHNSGKPPVKASIATKVDPAGFVDFDCMCTQYTCSKPKTR